MVALDTFIQRISILRSFNKESSVMRILILDDSTERHEAFARVFSQYKLTHCRGYWPFIAALQAEPSFDVVMLDHDLGDYAETKDFSILPGMYGAESMYTGLDAAIQLTSAYDSKGARKDELRPRVIIHSHNPPGAERMKAVLMDAGFIVIVHPFDLA